MTAEALAGGESFVELVEELEDIERRRSGSGNLEAGLAMRRAHVERVLIELLAGAAPSEEVRAAERVRCELMLRVLAGQDRTAGTVKELAPGGVYVETQMAAPVGLAVDLEIGGAKSSVEHSLRVRGRVLAAQRGTPTRPGGLFISVPFTDEAGERRLKRFVGEIIRARAGTW